MRVLNRYMYYSLTLPHPAVMMNLWLKDPKIFLLKPSEENHEVNSLQTFYLYITIITKQIYNAFKVGFGQSKKQRGPTKLEWN